MRLIAWLPLLLAVGVLSGGTAAISGFGIGSLLTPLLAHRWGTTAAVAAVAVPHAVATALRFWLLRRSVDWRVVARFGILSAVGGLLGAFLFTRLGGPSLTRVLGALLLLTAVMGFTGWNMRWRLKGPGVWLLGFLSGFFGGVVGNQGGLRAAALLGLNLTPAAFVATATATALLVDAARTPVYIWRSGDTLAVLWLPIAVATAGVLIGTLLGERLLLGMPAEPFRRAVSAVIGLLGVALLAGAI